MKSLVKVFVVCFCIYQVRSRKLPGPLVYVVTPSPKSLDYDHGRSAVQPFYYHNWRRMDQPTNFTTLRPTTTTTTEKPNDLIFAEFESDKTKNIRKLLEKERITTTTTTTTTTSLPINVPEEEENYAVKIDYSSQPTQNNEQISEDKDMTDFFDRYNSMQNNAPVYMPSSTLGPEPTESSNTEPTSLTPKNNVENIWQIIDHEKQHQHQYSGGWDEVPINTVNQGNPPTVEQGNENTDQGHKEDDVGGLKLDDNFAVPGFGTNHGNAAENESRAIRTDTDVRFPYVSLKPFQMKDLKKPLLKSYSNGKKGNTYTSLDNFREIKNPVRGEAQDGMPMREAIDRYNSALAYVPKYGSKSKQSSPGSPPMKAVANLVPPPPPPPPKVTADDFPAPTSYESFPPYAPSSFPSDAGPPPAPAASRPAMYQPPVELPDNSADSGPPGDDNDSGPPMDLGYRYKPPAPTQNFLPTLPPLIKPGGYSYEKPGYSYEKPPMDDDNGPEDEKPGYHYDKPMPENGHDSDPEYPELIFNKPHGHGAMKGGDDMKGDDNMGMVPPPPPAMPQGPTDDSGFPPDFPVDFKYHHFDDDHDFYHHHHHPTTTTTTTEQPRVNRYSYYYLGKKLYYLPLYFSVYFIIYVGALIIKAVLRHKITYPQSWKPNDTTATFFSKRSLDSWNPSHDNLHEITGKVTRYIASAAEKYMNNKDS